MESQRTPGIMSNNARQRLCAGAETPNSSLREMDVTGVMHEKLRNLPSLTRIFSGAREGYTNNVFLSFLLYILYQLLFHC